MATWDGELLENVFSVFAKKNKNDNLGWRTLGDALSPVASHVKHQLGALNRYRFIINLIS